MFRELQLPELLESGKEREGPESGLEKKALWSVKDSGIDPRSNVKQFLVVKILWLQETEIQIKAAEEKNGFLLVHITEPQEAQDWRWP